MQNIAAVSSFIECARLEIAALTRFVREIRQEQTAFDPGGIDPELRDANARNTEETRKWLEYLRALEARKQVLLKQRPRCK